ncbi:hypothetical protein [Sediminicoccus sp. KRV36]|uniref:hypothetical protein n=1 Tax=Sediminicoccus sp. KRV36 TaxID=3133721 RepID=UPI0020101198|nr:hypothetical protein [Sediminicoccus rosea]UPY39238.1 hypothetical protein LHU95_11255 [Sediminicoccus rosea]
MKQATDPVLNLYQGLMEEVKVRISSIDKATLGLLFTLPPQTVREFGFLQLRLCCERIALSCLVVHGDISASTKLRGDYQADKIISELEKINPASFPAAITATKRDGIWRIEPKDGYMKKAEFIELYRECGSYLHKGSLKNLIKMQHPKQISYPEITKRAQSIMDLLNIHMIYEPKSGKAIICQFSPANQSACVVVRADRGSC